MSPRGAYIPLSQYSPTPSLAHSRLFNSDLGQHEPKRAALISQLPRLSLRSLGISLVTGIILLVLLYPRTQLTWLQQALQGEGIDYRLSFNELYTASREGWRQYDPPLRVDEQAVHTYWETWVDRLEDECVERLIAKGEICRDWPKEANAVDAVWTWANGSDPLLQVWRAEVTASLSGKVSQGIAMIRATKRARHFRDHDELRYSIRSALDSFAPGSLSHLHLLAADLPTNTLLRDTIDPQTPADTTLDPSVPVLVNSDRIGQVPRWLSSNPSSSRPPLSISHHSAFFVNESNLPTFNSLSIESQFPFLSEVKAEFFLYMNDDTFLLGRGSLVETDVGSPLLGQVFRLQSDLSVGSSSPDELALRPEGEWASLERANWLLDQRFGKRERNYLAHIPKAMSMPILREIGLIWGEELEETASSRFRGRKVEYQLPFLATHFTIESHRQALLLAFVTGRIDHNGDGSLSLGERQAMLNELGFERDQDGTFGGSSTVFAPYRSTRDDSATQLAQAGLLEPRSTSLSCSSMDGYCPYRGDDIERSESGPVRPVRYDREPRKEHYCKIEASKCFGEEFLDLEEVSTLDLFMKISFVETGCGDCIIVHLVSTSGSRGLSSFLPDKNDASHVTSSSHESRLPFNLRSKLGATPPKTFDAIALPAPSSSRRLDAAREILRYSYVLSDSRSMFHGMVSPGDTQRLLKEITTGSVPTSRNLTFLTLNDDFPNDHVSEMAQPILEDFFARTWPDPSPYET
ncbi:hypothetical protein JCM16303_007016 [Sporobolomyces ruberrimus]